MLRGIPRAISPDLMKCMMEMGHGDVLVLVDANYPAHSHGKRVIRMDHVEIPELLEAALQFFSLDYFVDNPVRLMKNLPTEPVPEVWETYRGIIKKWDQDQAFKDFLLMDRLEFYQESERAYVIVQTGDTARYGNIALQKGVY